MDGLASVLLSSKVWLCSDLRLRLWSDTHDGCYKRLHGFCWEVRSGDSMAAIQRSSALTGQLFIVLQLDLKPTGQLTVDIRFFDQDPQQSVRIRTKPTPVNAASNPSDHVAPGLDVKGSFVLLSLIISHCFPIWRSYYHSKHDIFCALTPWTYHCL